VPAGLRRQAGRGWWCVIQQRDDVILRDVGGDVIQRDVIVGRSGRQLSSSSSGNDDGAQQSTTGRDDDVDGDGDGGEQQRS